MASDVSICNSALAKVNAQRITALTENTKAAKICNVILRPSLDFVTRAHPWSCAIARDVPALLAAAPAFEWTYQFRLPTDPYCLRVLNVYSSAGEPDYVIEGRALLCNESTVNLRYIKKITDFAEIDESLAETIAYYMAFQLAYPLKGSKSLKDDMWNVFDKRIKPVARSVDSMQRSTQTHEDGDWVTGRV